MKYEVNTTEVQDAGFAIKLQEENARRLNPVLINGKATRLPQLTAETYIQAIYDEVAEQGNQKQRALEEAEFQEKVKLVLDDPELRQMIEAKAADKMKKRKAL